MACFRAQSDTFASQSLPPFSVLTSSLLPCRFPACPSLFQSAEERSKHERAHPRNYEPTMTVPYRPSTQRMTHSSSSAMTDSGSDSDASEVVFTPDTSRANSVSASDGRRDSVIPRVTPRRNSRRTSKDGKAGGANGQQAKNMREKRTRGAQQACLFRNEDFLRKYVGWQRREQSGGNGNGAGLQTHKINMMRATESLLYYLLHQRRIQAIQEKRVPDMEYELQRVIEHGFERHPLAGTWLDPKGEPECDHESTHSKPCSAHGHPDWRDCRRQHIDNRFEINQANFSSEWRSLMWPERSDRVAHGRVSRSGGA